METRYDRVSSVGQTEKDRLINNWCWDNLLFIQEKIKFNPCFTPHTKINAKCVKDFNVKSQNFNLFGRKLNTFKTLRKGRTSKMHTKAQPKIRKHLYILIH